MRQVSPIRTVFKDKSIRFHRLKCLNAHLEKLSPEKTCVQIVKSPNGCCVWNISGAAESGP